MSSATLPTDNDKNIVRRAVLNSTISMAAIARLHLAKPDPNQWSNSGKWGAATFCRDKKTGTFYIKLVDMENNTGVLWSQTLRPGFVFLMETPFFYTFKSDADNCVAGLEFIMETEAEKFHRKLSNRDSVIKGDKPSKTHGKKIDKSMIGKPANFRHVGHIGYTPEKGFSVQNDDPNSDIISQLRSLGISKEEINNNREFINQFIKSNSSKTGNGSLRKPSDSPRPPVPSMAGAMNEPRRPSGPAPVPVRPLNKRPPPPPPPKKPHLSATPVGGSAALAAPALPSRPGQSTTVRPPFSAPPLPPNMNRMRPPVSSEPAIPAPPPAPPAPPVLAVGRGSKVSVIPPVAPLPAMPSSPGRAVPAPPKLAPPSSFKSSSRLSPSGPPSAVVPPPPSSVPPPPPLRPSTNVPPPPPTRPGASPDREAFSPPMSSPALPSTVPPSLPGRHGPPPSSIPPPPPPPGFSSPVPPPPPAPPGPPTSSVPPPPAPPAPPGAPPSQGASVPSGAKTAERSNLMASIRATGGFGTLKNSGHLRNTPKASPSPAASSARGSSSSGGAGGNLASSLAAALQQRKTAMRSDDEEEEDDEEW